jgi:putative tryptophan/tyrosine transport system substrate-binding protein
LGEGVFMRSAVKCVSGVVATLLLAVPLSAQVQPTAQFAWIGVLSPGSPGPDAGRRAFLQRLNELGWAAGQNVTFETRYAEGDLARLADLAADLVRLKVSVILAFGTAASSAAKRATATIPIVMFAGDPVGTGLVVSLARPGGNLTGLTQEAGLGIFAKRLELLKEVAPKTSRVGAVYNLTSPAEVRGRDATVESARLLGLTLMPLDVRSPADFEGAFIRARRERVDALAIAENALNVEHRDLIISFAAKNRLPTVFGERASVDAGGLMSYGADFGDILRRSATYIDKILKGAKPADLPVEQPTKFELVINLKTAKALGLTFPQSILVRADQVIE